MKNRRCEIRLERFNSILLSVLADIVRKLNDPKISKRALVVRVSFTKDLRHARIYITADPESIDETLQGFKRAKKFISYLIAQKLKNFRVMPSLSFHIEKEICSSI